jgi:hypothetical protein
MNYALYNEKINSQKYAEECKLPSIVQESDVDVVRIRATGAAPGTIKPAPYKYVIGKKDDCEKALDKADERPLTGIGIARTMQLPPGAEYHVNETNGGTVF